MGPLTQSVNDEDIRGLDTTNTFLVDMQVPMNRTQARQLNLQVSTFQITLPTDFGNIFLPNDVIIVRNHGDDEECRCFLYRQITQGSRVSNSKVVL
jgi:hypothetical protein